GVAGHRRFHEGPAEGTARAESCDAGLFDTILYRDDREVREARGGKEVRPGHRDDRILVPVRRIDGLERVLTGFVDRVPSQRNARIRSVRPRAEQGVADV